MPFQKKDISLEFPVFGIDRRLPGKVDSPGTSANAVNVRPDDTEEGRLRGGSRPGLIKAFAEELGSGARIQHLGQLNTVTDGIEHEYDTFSGTSIASKWSGAVAGENTFIDGYQKCVLNTSTRCAVGEYGNLSSGSESVGELVLRKIDDLDTSEPYTISSVIKSSAEGQQMMILFQLDDDITAQIPTGSVMNTYPDNCVWLKVSSVYSGGNTDISLWDLEEFTGGTRNAIAQDNSPSISVSGTDQYEIALTVDGTSLTITIGGTSLGGNPYTIGSGRTGTRMGFVIREFDVNGTGTVDGGVSRFTVDYSSLYNENRLSRRLVGIANGTFYVENDYGEMEADTSDVSLNTKLMLQGVDHLSKYYVADYGDEQTSGTGASLNAAGTTFTVAGEDFTANYDIDTDQHVLELYDVTGAAKAGMVAISAVGTTTLTLATSMTDGASTGTASYRIARGPKVYDPTAAAGSRMTHFLQTDIDALGSPPFGCRFVCRYSDRLCFAGDVYNAHLWYQSRQGEPLDWQYFPTTNDVGRAVAGQSTQAGGIGDQVVAQMPHSDDYLIYGSKNSIYVLRGDAAYGGRIDNISRDIGMVSGDAWCYGPMGELIFLTRDGIYSNERGVAAPIQSVSREKVPRELLDVDTDVYHVTMAYDAQERGIHFMMSPFVSTTATNHFFLTWPGKAFVRVDFQSDFDPFAQWTYSGDTHDVNGVLFGCRDGYIRKHSLTTHTDDGWEVDSLAVLGPIYLSQDETREGILQTLSIDLDDDSADVRLSIITGKNHAECIDKANAYILERTT